MRFRFAMLGTVILASLAVAQTQPNVNLNPAGQKPAGVAALPPPPAPLSPRLKQLLLMWEQKMKTVNSLEADIVRYDSDAVTKTQKVWQGKVKFLRPNRAYLRMDSKTDPGNYEEYVFTGSFLYEYLPRTKTLNIHELAAKPGQIVEDNFLNFLFGMKAEEAERRFQIGLAKEDTNYVYLLIDPKFAVDRQDFTKARMVLWATSYLPRQCEFETTNGDVVKWDIIRCDPMAKVSMADFQPREVPKDWATKKMPRQATVPTNGGSPQPTKVRPAGG
jgi:TIGR03009 family protein